MKSRRLFSFFPACSSSFRAYSFVCFVCWYEVFWRTITASSHTCSSLSTPKRPLRFQPTSPWPARASNALSSSLAGLQLLQKQTAGEQEQVLKVMRAKTPRWVSGSPASTETHTHTMGINGRLTVTQWGSRVNEYTVHSLCARFLRSPRVNYAEKLLECSSVVTDRSFDLKWTFSRLCTWGCETFQSRLTFIMKDEITISNPFLPLMLFWLRWLN